jgi:hypothetical protein
MWSMSGGDGSWMGCRGLVRAPFWLDEMEILAHPAHGKNFFRRMPEHIDDR